MFIEHLLILPLCMHCLSRYEALEKLREHSNEVANDRPSPEIPHDSRAVSRAPTRVCDVEGGAVCSKNSTFGYFYGAAWTPRSRSPTPWLLLQLNKLSSLKVEIADELFQ